MKTDKNSRRFKPTHTRGVHHRVLAPHPFVKDGKLQPATTEWEPVMIEGYEPDCVFVYFNRDVTLKRAIRFDLVWPEEAS